MERKSVQSSDLLSVGYDQGGSILEIEFKSGDVYQYLNVPGNIYINLMSAASHGRFFNANIKNIYSYRKI